MADSNYGSSRSDKAIQFPHFLAEPAEAVAKRLLGCVLERQLPQGVVRTRIVETEAYDENDEASHAFGGKKLRNATMFGPSGHLYVYFTYGMHYCCNIVTGTEGSGSGVLIRALEPIDGIALIAAQRNMPVTSHELTNGPAKLTQALAIDRSYDGHDLHNAPIRLFIGNLRADERIATTARVGISKARTLPRRFYIANNPYVSRAKVSAML